MSLVILTSDPRLIEIIDELMDPDLDFSGEEYDDYWCINIKPFKCNSCGTLVCYASGGPHLIIIWAEKDDETLLELADLLMKDGSYDPHVVSYNRILGPCISFEKAKEMGWLGEIE